MKYKLGDIIEVRVISCNKRGANCEIGREKCFIHISQFADYHITNINTFVQVGDILKAEVISVGRGYYNLSYKSIRNIPANEKTKPA